MKQKINPLQEAAVVYAGGYTYEIFRRMLWKNRSRLDIHFLIKDLKIRTMKNPPCRVDLELIPRDVERNHVRKANLFELIHFALLHPEIVRESGPVEGADPNLERSCAELKIKSGIAPYVAFSNGKILVSIDHLDEKIRSKSKLVVIYARH